MRNIKKLAITTIAGTSLALLFALGCTPHTTGTTEVETTQDTAPAVQENVGTVYEGALSEPIVVNSDEDVTITLKNATLETEGSCIKVEKAKSVTIVLEGESTLTSTGDADAVEPKTISSAVDTTVVGNGTLNITSTDTCIKSKTNLTIESGTFNLKAGSDGNGLRADETLTVKGGTFIIDAGECLEATVVEILAGDFTLTSDDDAINASEKSELGLSPLFTISGGNVKITMAQGDTDGIDSNGDIVINGGTIDITAQSAFDWDGDLAFNGGTVIVNGEVVTEISNQFGGMGEGPNLGMNGAPGDIPGGPGGPGAPPQ